MADNTTLGTMSGGDVIADDDVGGVKYQRVKLTPGPDGSAGHDVGGRDVDGGTSNAALFVDNRAKVVRIAVTPTISTSPAYSVKDAVGGLMTFSNAVRASGGSCLIQALQIVDKDNTPQDSALDLVLFDRSITAPTDNAIFAPSDAEAANCVGIIPVLAADYGDFSVNSIASRFGLGLEVVLNGTDLFGVLVARGTPTYSSTTDLVVTLTIIQD